MARGLTRPCGPGQSGKRMRNVVKFAPMTRQEKQMPAASRRRSLTGSAASLAAQEEARASDREGCARRAPGQDRQDTQDTQDHQESLVCEWAMLCAEPLARGCPGGPGGPGGLVCPGCLGGLGCPGCPGRPPFDGIPCGRPASGTLPIRSPRAVWDRLVRSQSRRSPIAPGTAVLTSGARKGKNGSSRLFVRAA